MKMWRKVDKKWNILGYYKPIFHFMDPDHNIFLFRTISRQLFSCANHHKPVSCAIFVPFCASQDLHIYILDEWWSWCGYTQ